ncbi:hypothetical protein V6N12_070713 [Hibiscus sabdariffa]|uniref:Uncharacterized protein n=1 Tax=Hibiscus sabdariffa TaxID=183260 RepID=A0ABR2FHM7_9ROSI
MLPFVNCNRLTPMPVFYQLSRSVEECYFVNENDAEAKQVSIVSADAKRVLCTGKLLLPADGDPSGRCKDMGI